MTVIQAIGVFCIWTLIAVAAGVLVGRVIKLGTAPERPYDQEQDELCEVLHFDCERRRRRGDVRNGISGGAA